MLKQGSLTVAVHEQTLMITGTECIHYMLYCFGGWHAIGFFLANKKLKMIKKLRIRVVPAGFFPLGSFGHSKSLEYCTVQAPTLLRLMQVQLCFVVGS